MFKEKNLSLLAYSGVFSLFSYQTEELSEAVAQRGYFQSAKQIRKDNILYIKTKDKNSMYKVIDDDGTVVDMFNGEACNNGAPPQEAIEDIALNEVSEKFDSDEVNENFQTLESAVNDILAVLRSANLINT